MKWVAIVVLTSIVVSHASSIAVYIDAYTRYIRLKEAADEHERKYGWRSSEVPVPYIGMVREEEGTHPEHSLEEVSERVSFFN